MSKIGTVNRRAVIQRDKCCRACGLPSALETLLDVDHIDPQDKQRYGGARIAPWLLQCLCRHCNNVKGNISLELHRRQPEYNVYQIAENQRRFSEIIDTMRPDSARKVARLAKRK